MRVLAHEWLSILHPCLGTLKRYQHEGDTHFITFSRHCRAHTQEVDGELRIISARKRMSTRRSNTRTPEKPLDFNRGVIASIYQCGRAARNSVILDADLIEAFPDSASVKTALRTLKEVATRAVKPPKPANPRVDCAPWPKTKPWFANWP